MRVLFILAGLTAPAALLAQMPNMGAMNSASMYVMQEASGTSMNPNGWKMPMLVTNAKGWSWMFMGQAFLVDTQQAGPRGGDKLYSTNWFMTSAEHVVGNGVFKMQLMMSLEPATITQRRYPELFQTGETAFGNPIVDGQHPHNLIMGLGFTYAHPIGHNGMWEAYYAPVGDPALGPVAFPHRASSYDLPQAVLGHHWEDSTHIAYNVATLAAQYKKVRLETSGFHGGEPGENRWTIGSGAMDSWSARLSVFPTKRWMAQVSTGRLTNPEAGHHGGDVVRTTASLHYTAPLRAVDWSTSLIWGRNHNTENQHNSNALTAETLFPLSAKHSITGRVEWVDKDELFPHAAALEEDSFQIGAYTAGYTRRLAVAWNRLETAVGANATAYTLPAAIKPYYGDRPWAVSFYLRLRLLGE